MSTMFTATSSAVFASGRSLFYIIAMVALAFHLWHGVWSMFQTLGLINPNSDKIIHRLAAIATLALVIGFISIPMAVLAGLIS